MPELYVSWSDYHQKIETLAAKIYQSRWDFNQIVCIAKGGLRVGDILSRIFEQPLAIVYAKSYEGEGNRTRGQITIAPQLLMLEAKLGDRVLLVDDLTDSGISLEQSVTWLKENFGEDIQEIRTGVIWCKGSSIIKPDYYVDYLPDNPWIHQPFEYYEQITPGDLLKHLES
ncbi:phosphoribosyltransferase [Gloeocapsa sp. PCC 73106]|uniref:phosphoribosyltransferase n=1 Tax=Gloeocapsa sp. PCC 73106 TaxID=102232 RepID=UPI0002ACB1E0|nr:phosphoribosyltransferase family protein [Gloeocapsa sp. PCC 73106]ELR96596.1 putative phosphoribosyltransferase [Gloeocapsa sp. PCC 73106]